MKVGNNPTDFYLCELSHLNDPRIVIFKGEREIGKGTHQELLAIQ